MKTFSEVYETLPGNGWLTKTEAELLWEYAMAADGPILEVGCFEGRSTVLLANATFDVVHSVDPFDGFNTEDPDGGRTMQRFNENLKCRKIRNVHLHICRIEDWSPIPVELAYLDGDHSPQGTIRQIEVALLCNPRFIAVHDIAESGDGLRIKQACLNLLGIWESRVERLAIWRMPS